MTRPYGRDLATISLDEFRHDLASGYLAPSRESLREDLPQNFARLAAMGITNVGELLDALKTKKRLADFASETGLSEDYLTLLRRQAGTYVPTPPKLAQIPGVDPVHAEGLAAAGIKNTQHLFARAALKEERRALADETGVPVEVIGELVRMADIARVGYVGPVYARLLLLAGVDSLATLAGQSPEDLYERVRAVNAEQQLTRAAFALKDVRLTIESAQQLPIIAEF